MVDNPTPTDAPDKDDALNIITFRNFIESITLANGPYPDLNGHRIVRDARHVLNGKDYDRG